MEIPCVNLHKTANPSWLKKAVKYRYLFLENSLKNIQILKVKKYVIREKWE